MKLIRKILIRNDKKYYWSEKDLHTDSGIIKEDDLKKDLARVKSHAGKEFFMFPALFTDKVDKIKRLPQALLEKDIALILIYTGIDRNSVVLEAGTGSGKLTVFLAKNVKKVISYEINNQHAEIAKQNLEFLDIKNVEIKNKDIYNGIEEKNLDLIVLDLPEPYRVVKYAQESLRPGSFLVACLPTITQVSSLVNEMKNYPFVIVKTVELIEREWLVEDKRVRPKNTSQHTVFLTFARKV